MKHTFNDLPVGTEVYYTGDCANEDGFAVVTRHRLAEKWHTGSVDIQDELEPVITAVTTLYGELLHLRSTELAKVEAALDRWLKDNPPEPPTQDEP